MSKIVCFGEVLWDVFPDHKTIGGAPLNVALRLSSFGNEVIMISSVGEDANGKEILRFAESNSINIDLIQVTKEFKTGKVNVILDEQGAATYNIKTQSAWDNIKITDVLKKKVRSTDAFVFGSLVARNDVSQNTLFELLKVAPYKFFDVNLRPPHYSKEILIKLMQEADFIKFNDDELMEICNYYNFHSNNLESNIKFIAKQTRTDRICVTLGKNGAILFLNNNFFKNKGFLIKIKDTVGAGDSFLASLISKLLENKPPQEALDFASAVGAIVASSKGANPKIEERDIKRFLMI